MHDNLTKVIGIDSPLEMPTTEPANAHLHCRKKHPHMKQNSTKEQEASPLGSDRRPPERNSSRRASLLTKPLGAAKG